MKTKEQWERGKIQCINNWITELALANERIEEIDHKVHEMEVEKENLEDYVRDVIITLSEKVDESYEDYLDTWGDLGEIDYIG